MRVTSNLFPESLKDQINSIQTRQLFYQYQSSTGLKLKQSSDNPSDFGATQAAQEDLSSIIGYNRSSADAEQRLQRNHTSMTQLHTLLSRAYELGQRANNVYNSGDIQAFAAEMEEIIEQVRQLANTQVDGYYVFGGTENLQPVTGATVPTYALNPATTANVPKNQVNENYSIDVGIVAGDGVAANGFLWDGTTNVMTSLQNAYNALAAGSALNAAQISGLRLSSEIASGVVGQTAARLAALEANSTRLRDDTQRGKERTTELTQANMAETLTELSKTQFHYQAALQSGSRILNISLLDYLR